MRFTTIGLMLLLVAALCASAIYAGHVIAGRPLDIGVMDALGQRLFGHADAAAVDAAGDLPAMHHPATRAEVFDSYGAPTQISDGGDQWWYDDLIVMFRDDRVVGWVPLHISHTEGDAALRTGLMAQRSVPA